MVVIVPITVTMPTVPMFVPPLLALSPAPYASFPQFAAPMICLPAVVSMVLDSLVKLVFGARCAAIAIVIMPGRARHARKQKHSRQRHSGQRVLRDSFYSR